MVDFITLFLGLVAGPIHVELAVQEPVAEVRLELDGESVATLDGPPWELDLDLGGELKPRRVVARAFDSRGAEIDDATQYLNLPRPPAEVSVMLRRNEAGRATSVGLAWESRLGAPIRVSASLDGRRLDVQNPSRIGLPALDPAVLHVLETEVEFSNGMIALDQIALGGEYLDRASAQLTAVRIDLPRDRSEISRETLEANSLESGETLLIGAVDRADAEVVFVRDRWAGEALRQLMSERNTSSTLSGAREARTQRVYETAPFVPEESLRVLYPLGIERMGQRLNHELFMVTPPITEQSGGGIYWHLTSEPEVAQARNQPRLSDAVAVAGSQAAGENRRRAVVLLLAPGSEDKGSRFGPETIRAYLKSLGVPLYVWYLGKAEKAPAAWGQVTGIRGVGDLKDALSELRSALDRQRIVWVEGLHLPEEVVVTVH